MTTEELEPLFPPQVRAIERGIQLKRCPVLGAMGSGKTRVALGIYDALTDWRKATKPTGILANVNAMPAWIRQLSKWLNIPEDQIAIAQGNKPQERKRVWTCGHYAFIITTPASFLRDKQTVIPKNLNWMMDEYHRYMRKRTTTWEALCSWMLHSEIVLPLSGTPMWNGPQDFFPVMHLCNRKTFRGFWDFVHTWCIIIEGPFGQEIAGAKNADNFRQYIYGGYAAYMPKKETDKYLPKKHRTFEPVKASPFQRKLLNEVAQKIYLELSDKSLVINPNRMVQILRERQILCTPKLLDPSWEYGAGIEYILDKLEEQRGALPRPVIFTDFATAVPIIAQAVREQFDWRKVHELRGGLKVDELMQRVDQFNNSEDDVMVCSMTYAESFEFPRSQVCHVLGFNWSAPVCEQAEDRLRRAISEFQNIRCMYVQYERTIEGYMLDRIRGKQQNVNAVTPDDIRGALAHVGGAFA